MEPSGAQSGAEGCQRVPKGCQERPKFAPVQPWLEGVPQPRFSKSEIVAQNGAMWCPMWCLRVPKGAKWVRVFAFVAFRARELDLRRPISLVVLEKSVDKQVRTIL